MASDWLIPEIRELVMHWGLAGGEEPEFKLLGGGVSCHVVLVTSSKGKWVVKKALPRLMVKDEWLADRWRIFRETGCLKVIRELVDKDAAPQVLLEDRESYSCVLEYGEGGVTWKKLLMDGVVDNEVTTRVASILATLHKVGTLTETLEAIKLCRQLGITPIVSARSGDTEDSFIADLAVGAACPQIKIGSIARSERTVKYNRLLQIERELEGKTCLYGRKSSKPTRRQSRMSHRFKIFHRPHESFIIQYMRFSLLPAAQLNHSRLTWTKF
ncbi:MAG: phosphotransferase [Candidatus Caldarchaeum sp.]|uniref:phosphopyruvate hydratase n=1 Tax=Caldiarchaeum subterraneum TaxID=311458 RepID=A0A7J3WCM0_CALS0